MGEESGTGGNSSGPTTDPQDDTVS